MMPTGFSITTFSQSTLRNSLNAIRLQFEDNINVYELSEKEQLEFVRKYIKKVELDKID